MKPFFITGANAKVRVNDVTMAFCTDVSYSVQVLTKVPKTLGTYEGTSVEPLGYNVSGSFTVIRYAKEAQRVIGKDSAPSRTSVAGNGVGNWGTAWGGSILANAGVGNDGRAHEALDPSKFATGTTFDIEISQMISDNASPGNTTSIGVALIRGCRITQADFQMSKKGVATQRFSFVALYADEDSFVADFSGTGAQF